MRRQTQAGARRAAAALLLLAWTATVAPSAYAEANELLIVGSGNLARFLTPLAAAYQELHPGVRVRVEAGTSTAGPPALLRGRAQLAAMSREMSRDELHAFKVVLGARPARTSVAIDALAIYVNEQNPLQQISLPELDAIYSSARRCGGEEAITSWSQLGLQGSYAARSIGLYGHIPSAGTYAFFRQKALCGGHFREGVHQQPGDRSVVLSIAELRYAMGYGARADLIAGVRALAVAPSAGGSYGTIAPADVYDGRYPLTRDLYLYRTTRRGEERGSAEALRFVRFVLSKTGQDAVDTAGFLRLPESRLAEEHSRLD